MKKRKTLLFAKYAGSIADIQTPRLSEEEIKVQEHEFERIESLLTNRDMFNNAKIGDQFKNRKGHYGVYCGMYQNTFHVVRFNGLGNRHYHNDGKYYECIESEYDIVEKVQDCNKKQEYDMPCFGACSNWRCQCNVNHSNSFL